MKPIAADNRRGGALRPLAPEQFGEREARHLLWRAGFGGPPGASRELAGLGLDGAVARLLDFSSASPDGDGGFSDGVIRPLPFAERQELQRARQRRDEDTLARFRMRQQEMEQADRAQMREIQRWWLARMAETPCPLQEKLALFWHGHFATSYRTVENSWHMLLQNRLFRSEAAGSFATLLRSVIRDPAMLAFLDNNRSRAGAPNENLARELMELFSLGAGGYTEADIKDGARALTGYGFEGNEFVFRRDWHDGGRKEILGRDGALDGDAFVEAILAQPRCTEFIALKLYRFFVHDMPGGPGDWEKDRVEAVKDLAATLRRSNYELRPALTRLFKSAHFYDDANRASRIKSPVELVVGLLRTLDPPEREPRTLLGALDLMGQRLFMPPSVAGWPDGRAWINTSTLFVRQNAAVHVLTGRTGQDADRPRPFLRRAVDPTPLVSGLPDDADAETIVLHLLDELLGEAAAHVRSSPERLAALVDFARSQPEPASLPALIKLLALITALPEHQLC